MLYKAAAKQCYDGTSAIAQWFPELQGSELIHPRLRNMLACQHSPDPSFLGSWGERALSDERCVWLSIKT